MCVISFQGLCFFQSSGTGAEVLLPRADTHAEHLDGRDARPHHARVFVHEDRAIDPVGFTACAYGRGQVTRGWYFPLSNGSRNGRYIVRVAGSRAPVGTTGLVGELPSFSAFAGDCHLSVDPWEAAAVVKVTRGCFRTHLTLGTWKVDGRLGDEAEFEQPAWRFDWIPGAPAGGRVEITIHDARDNDCVASVKVEAGQSTEEAVIIGNLDVSNPASWPDRENASCENCEDEEGRPSEKDCYENDFKWHYRLLTDRAKADILKILGDDPLPVPVLEGDCLGAMGTPTCFPAML